MILTTLLLYSRFSHNAVEKSLTPLEDPTYFDLFGESGLINIPCEDLEIDGNGTECNASSKASSISTPNSTIIYRFKGSKVYILADLSETSSAEGEIIIDNEIVKSIDFSDASPNQLVFSSNELLFDEHEIRIKHKGPENHQIRIISLYIQPYPQHQGFSLGFDSLHDYIGEWGFLYPSKSEVSAFKSDSIQAACTFTFYGTQFWLTGIRSSEYGNLNLTLDYGQPISIHKKSTNANFQDSILLYQSDILPFGEHILTINRLDGPIAIFKLLFTIHPYLEIPTYSKAPQSIPVSIPASNMTHSDGTREELLISCYERPYANPCGSIHTCISDKATFEYTFKGECFQVYGSKYNGQYDISLDGQLIQTIHQNNESNYHLDFTSEIYPYGEHSIKIELYANASIYKIAFWPSIKAKRIEFTNFTLKDESIWISEPDNIGGQRYYNEGFGNSNLFYSNLQASKIWIYGTKTSWYNKLLYISFANQNFQNSVYNQERIDFALLRELQFDQITKGTLSLTGGPIQYNYVYYIEEPLLGLPISIPTSSMTVNTTSCQEFSIANCKNEVCMGFCGNISTATAPTSFEYTFNGEMFQIYGYHSPDHKSYDIYLDNVYITTINQFNLKNTGYVLDYSSNVYPYGKHTIRAEGNETFSIHKFAFWPSCKAKRINITSFNLTGNWTAETDDIGGQRSYAQWGSAISSIFQANKLWIYGTKATWHRTASFSFGSYVSKQLNEQIEESEKPREDFVLIYESPYFAYRKEKVVFQLHQAFLLNYIYYLDEPTSAVAVFIPSALSADNKECSIPTVCSTDITNFPCGIICRSNKFEYRFKGECFEVYGTHGSQLPSYNIYIDDILVYSPNQNTSPEGNYQLDYISYILPYGWHTIKAEGSTAFSISSFAYWPSVNAKRINASDFESTGAPKNESDSIGGIGIYQDGSNSFSSNITFQKIWVYGTIADWHGSCKIEFGSIEEQFSEYVEQGANTSFQLVYDSPLEIADGFVISYLENSIGKARLYFHYAYYVDCDFLPIPTPVFSSSFYFTNSNAFSETSEFSRTESFSTSESFSLSTFFSSSALFSSSGLFSNSNSFTPSTMFSESLDFSSSLSFSFSFDFTDSNTISSTEVFTKSDIFSKTNSLSQLALGSYSDKKGAPVKLIIGVVVGIILLLLIIVLIILYIVKRRSSSPKSELNSEMDASTVSISTAITLNNDEINGGNSETFDFFGGFGNLDNSDMNFE